MPIALTRARESVEAFIGDFATKGQLDYANSVLWC
jgi:hypothetical protein